MDETATPIELSDLLGSEQALVAAAVALGAPEVPSISQPELALVRKADPPALKSSQTKALTTAIRSGLDPLGSAFSTIRSPEERRPMGATYTPSLVIEAMCDWSRSVGKPQRVVDPGTGSARFLMAAGRMFRSAQLIGIEVDPLAALIARANLAASGMAKRSVVVLDDFRAVTLDVIEGKTLWIGNPPYVRHHQIAPDWKDWLAASAAKRGMGASKLAGLHVHFFMATAMLAQAGDYGAYVTAAEWLDVNYGSLVRELLLGPLGGSAVHMLSPDADVFADAVTTSAISCFTIGSRPTSLRMRKVDKPKDLGQLDGGRRVRRERLADAPRWSPFLSATKAIPEGFVELGELCRVHRGTVTGANHVWVSATGHPELPSGVLTPSVTKAKELFAAGVSISSAESLRRVVDLPTDLDELDADDRVQVDAFLSWAKRLGAHQGYIARHRKAWWSIGMRSPAPILATYMARRPPTFVRNLADARHINIAHGLYPRQALDESTLDRLAEALRGAVTQAQGRTYAGGLTKFEPREMERIPINVGEVLLD